MPKYYRVLNINGYSVVPFFDNREYPIDEIESMILERGFKTEVPSELIRAYNRDDIDVDYLSDLVLETLELDKAQKLNRKPKDSKNKI